MGLRGAVPGPNQKDCGGLASCPPGARGWHDLPWLGLLRQPSPLALPWSHRFGAPPFNLIEGAALPVPSWPLDPRLVAFEFALKQKRKEAEGFPL